MLLPINCVMGLLSKCSELNKGACLRLCSAIVSLLDDSLSGAFAAKSSGICDWGGSNLDANSLQSGSVLNAMQKPKDYEQLQEVKSIKNQ